MQGPCVLPSRAMSTLPDCLMSPRELDVLDQLAAGRTVLELGAWRGVTTLRLATVADQVVTIDHHRGDAHTGPADTLADYFAAVRGSDLRDCVVSIVGDIESACYVLREGTFDLVLVDAAHDYDSVRSHLSIASVLVRPRGTIALHDWGRYDVTRAALNVRSEPDNIIDSLALYHIDGQ